LEIVLSTGLGSRNLSDANEIVESDWLLRRGYNEYGYFEKNVRLVQRERGRKDISTADVHLYWGAYTGEWWNIATF